MKLAQFERYEKHMRTHLFEAKQNKTKNGSKSQQAATPI